MYARSRAAGTAGTTTTSVVPVARAVVLEEGAEQVAVAPVGQELQGGVGCQPAQLVHLVVGEEAPTGRSHLPVGDRLQAATPVAVVDPPQEVTGPAAQTGLLLDLTQGGLLLGLALLQLPLGERPVVLQRTMHQRQLEATAAVPVAAPDDPSGGSDDPRLVPEHCCRLARYRPERLLARNWPCPGWARSLPWSTSTWPRCSTTSGTPRTPRPS